VFVSAKIGPDTPEWIESWEKAGGSRIRATGSARARLRLEPSSVNELRQAGARSLIGSARGSSLTLRWKEMDSNF
jgi:hypothetical protein